MRKAVLILSLVAATCLAATNDVFAQRGRRGGGRVAIGVSPRGYYYGSRGASIGVRSGAYYYGPRGYYPRYYYRTSYYSTSGYYYSDPVVQVPAREYRQSFYSDPNVATLTVLVPNAEAQVWFDDAPTTQRGMERTFHTPALQQAGTYTIRARWKENGRAVDRQRRVKVQPGESVVVDLRQQ